MNILVRCKKCLTFYSRKHKACPKCKSKEGRYYVSQHLNGKRKFTVGGTLQEAKELEAKILLDMQERKEKFKANKITLMTFAKEVFLPQFLRADIVRGDEERMKKKEVDFWTAIKAMPNKPLKDITPEDIDICLKSILERGLTAGTYNRRRGILSSLLNTAVNLGYLSSSPLKSKPIKTESRERFLTEDEKVRLIKACKESTAPFLYPMVMVAIKTGMRLGEIQRMQRSWIYDDYIHIPAKVTKTRKSRVIPICEELNQVLNDLEGEFKFWRRINTPFKKALEVAGIKDFRFHDLRHTFASELVQNGVSDYTVSILLGHSSTQMTRRYSHLSDDSLKEAVKKLDAPKAPKEPKEAHEKPKKLKKPKKLEAGYKFCPDCAEPIREAAVVCRFCGYRYYSKV